MYIGKDALDRENFADFVKNRSIYEEGYLGYILDGSQLALTLPKKGEAVLGLPVESAE